MPNRKTLSSSIRNLFKASNASTRKNGLTLEALPTEILERIVLVESSLTNDDRLKLRLVNRTISEKVSYAVGHACFSTIKTDLSVQTLLPIKIASEWHPFLKQHVTTLVLVITDVLAEDFHWHRNASGGLSSFQEQPSALTLTNFFTNDLPRVNSFSIFGGDHLDLENLPYADGWRKFPSLNTRSDCILAPEAFLLILNIVSACPAPVRSLTVNFQCLEYVCRTLRRFTMADLYAELMHTLSNQQLQVTLSSQVKELVFDKLGSPKSIVLVANMAASAGSLKRLSLHFKEPMAFTFKGLPRHCAFLAEPSNPQHFGPCFPHLEYLSLVGINGTDGQLMGLLRRLLPMCNSPLKALRLNLTVDDDLASWNTTFQDLRQRFKHLTHFDYACIVMRRNPPVTRPGPLFAACVFHPENFRAAAEKAGGLEGSVTFGSQGFRSLQHGDVVGANSRFVYDGPEAGKALGLLADLAVGDFGGFERSRD